ncbi:MAG: hypothetical protein JJU28_00180 [Cyclobacteriaceae bacterium]|nr:hypothetical protein [Cyclobacteriaceae bacterium]
MNSYQKRVERLQKQSIDNSTDLSGNVKVIFLFLVQPFVLFLFSLRKYKANWAKNALWLFTFFYGLTFAISPDSSADSVQYAQRLVDMHSYGWDLNRIFVTVYAVDGFRDIFQPLLTFIVSRFTDNYTILFGLFGLFLGYFYSRNIWTLIEYSGDRLNMYGVLLLAVFAFIVSISSGINGVRMWTGAHVFIFGCFRYLLDNKQNGLLIAASATLVHFAYIVPSLLLLGYMLVGNRLFIYYVIFVISYFISELDFEIARQMAVFLPEVFREGTTGYISEAVERRVQAGVGLQRERSWFLVWNSILFPLSIFLMVSYIFLFKRKVIQGTIAENLFGAGLLFYGVFNILGYYPSVHRYLSPAAMLLFAFFFLYVQHQKDRNFRWLILIVSPALLLYLAINFRLLLEFASFLWFIGNPILVPFIDADMGLYEFIRQYI